MASYKLNEILALFILAERHSTATAGRRRASTKWIRVLIIINLNYCTVSGWTAASCSALIIIVLYLGILQELCCQVFQILLNGKT
jgi:hypothetical protein